VKKLAEFFTLGNWECFCFYLDNQRSYGQTDGAGRFSASTWSRINPPRCSDCRLLMLYKVVKELWAEFFALGLRRCSAQPCNNQQNYGQMDVDSAGQKGPNLRSLFMQPPFLPFSTRTDSAGVDSSRVTIGEPRLQLQLQLQLQRTHSSTSSTVNRLRFLPCRRI